MKTHYLVFILSVTLVVTSCASLGIPSVIPVKSDKRVEVFKPKKHRRMYNPRKDKKSKRLKALRMKS